MFPLETPPDPFTTADMKTALVLLLTFCTSLVFAGDWRNWRGPTHDGKAAAGPMPPLSWSDSENVLWVVDIPGRGHSSPTIVGDKIYMATATDSEQSILALDRNSGKMLGQKVIHTGGIPPKIHKKNTHASATIAADADGKGLYVTFYNGGKIILSALGADGNIRWQKDVGPFQQKYEFGYAASPVLYRDMVIATAESESLTALIAYDTKTGAERWRAKRPKNSSYSTPGLLKVGGRDQLIITGNQELVSYDPANGNKLWSAPGSAQHTAGTVTGEGDLVIGSGGYPQRETVCVKADGSGKVVWKNKMKCYEQSMLMHDGHVYMVNDDGMAACYVAATGEEKWKERTKGPVSASPILVGDRIYASNELGTTFVIKADPANYQLLATNQLGNDTFPTPVFVDGKVYIRTAFREDGKRQERLYCIGSK